MKSSILGLFTLAAIGQCATTDLLGFYDSILNNIPTFGAVSDWNNYYSNYASYLTAYYSDYSNYFTDYTNYLSDYSNYFTDYTNYLSDYTNYFSDYSNYLTGVPGLDTSLLGYYQTWVASNSDLFNQINSIDPGKFESFASEVSKHSFDPKFATAAWASFTKANTLDLPFSVFPGYSRFSLASVTGGDTKSTDATDATDATATANDASTSTTGPITSNTAKSSASSVASSSSSAASSSASSSTRSGGGNSLTIAPIGVLLGLVGAALL
ncbi:uncharacterized protein KQ657_001123 [Scheffersomyces spartinae]|uniref:Uncharacterized protein n=1 Tax=Scheffersomyces spartinae TaxID=45513 RepID=A0A9P7V832_9ASCO|nr:uncharacterized protein KQ657_001123 [Scheffersomyces spartinae]KAG7193010.1 hypothetical protein KQ657_001123 [Scheffersomyces spartinae]